jgi:hypothetical protein
VQGGVAGNLGRVFVDFDFHKRQKAAESGLSRELPQVLPLPYAGMIRIRFKGSSCKQDSQCFTPLGRY